MSITANIKAAFAAGVLAHRAGLKAAPILDQSFNLLVKTARDAGIIGTEVGSSLMLMVAWNKGWHSANLNAA